MNTELINNSEQSSLWNGTAGRAWVEIQDLLDHMFQPFEDLLADTVLAGGEQRVLDVGCGTGSTTLATARRVGKTGHAVGIDISAPMIALAKSRAKRDRLPASFICADAQRHPFEPPYFDLIISRFGVMFFDDSVSAFTNLKQLAGTNGALHFYAWRCAEENPFMTSAERAAKAMLSELPTRRPDKPGQFAFARQPRVYSILQQSGWSAINIEPVDIVCTFPEAGLMRYVASMGPVGRLLHTINTHDRQNVVETVRAAFDPYVVGNDVSFIAACWKVTAQAD